MNLLQKESLSLSFQGSLFTQIFLQRLLKANWLLMPTCLEMLRLKRDCLTKKMILGHSSNKLK